MIDLILIFISIVNLHMHTFNFCKTKDWIQVHIKSSYIYTQVQQRYIPQAIANSHIGLSMLKDTSASKQTVSENYQV